MLSWQYLPEESTELFVRFYRLGNSRHPRRGGKRCAAAQHLFGAAIAGGGRGNASVAVAPFPSEIGRASKKPLILIGVISCNQPLFGEIIPRSDKLQPAEGDD
jgi:hypothetical protein